MAETISQAALPRAGAFYDAGHARRYWITLLVLAVLAAGFVFGSLAWDNPMPLGSDGFWRIAQLRASALAVVVLVAFCQGVATVAFQTVTNNRIITPSIMGFESLYRLVQTLAVFFFGIAGASLVRGPVAYLIQVAMMVALAGLIYGWLLTSNRADLHLTLLIGIVIGTAMGSVATFVQRLLSPGEFDVLTARLIGSIANSSPEYLPITVLLAALAGGALWAMSRKLNVMGLGREAATGLGVDHRSYSVAVLLLVAVLMAVSTSLVGPMSFLGFLIAMITYQLADTYDHRYLFPMVWLVGIVVLAGAYFTLKHIFYAQGSVGIIIEAVGGTFFIVYLLRKGRL